MPGSGLHVQRVCVYRIQITTQRRGGSRWITQLETAGITTVPQFLSLGDNGTEVRIARANRIAWGLLRPVVDFASHVQCTL